MDRQEHNFCGGRDSADFGRGYDAIHDGHIDVHQDNVRLQFHDFFYGFFAILRIAAYLKGMPIEEFADGCPRGVLVIHNKYACRQIVSPRWPRAFGAGYSAATGLSVQYGKGRRSLLPYQNLTLPFTTPPDRVISPLANAK